MFNLRMYPSINEEGDCSYAVIKTLKSVLIFRILAIYLSLCNAT